MSIKKNNNKPGNQNEEQEEFEEFLKSLASMKPEEARSIFQDIINTMEEDNEPVPFSLRLLTTDVLYGVTETPFGRVYGIGGMGQLMLTGFISDEDIEETGSIDSVLEEIMADFSENFTMVTIKQDDKAVGEMINQVLKGDYVVSDEVFEAMEASKLQRTVWRELTQIPYGQTISYEDLAARVGKPKAVRAVATAVGQNPLSLAIPCHRIIPKNGGYGEYHWGAEVKKKLLDHEQATKSA
jgi:AraC family transcriptional regulator of adaptative response/methylated-DNA-[protein]-cysteine methyltransferase